MNYLRSIPLQLTRRPLMKTPLSAVRHYNGDVNNSEKTVLTKGDLVSILSKEYEMPVAQSARVLDTVLDTIVEAVTKSHTVSISNFGKFESVSYPARMYSNPITKVPTWKEEGKRVKFRAFTNFKECVNKKR